jgi:uncharacterized protein YcnI
MATFTGRRAVLRLLTVAVVGASIPIIGRPASAHTEVEVEPARAGATNALVTLTAEAESGTAGVTAIEVFLPAGIAPRDVTLVTAPRGWHLSTASESYRVSGPPLAVGTNARHQVRVRQLPNASRISFKVLQTYRDGRVDRWIEVPSAANPQPANPAPTVALAGAVAAPSATAATSEPATASATTRPPPGGSPTATRAASTSASRQPWWWIAAGVIVAAGVAVLIRWRRRSIRE